MGTLIKIAFRNLIEHKTKSLIIGVLVALGLFLLVLGNSIFDTAKAGVRTTFIENLTGDIMVRQKSTSPMSLFGGQGMPGGGSGSSTVKGYPEIYAYLKGLDSVATVNSQVAGFATHMVEDKGGAFFTYFGIDPGSYLSMFPNMVTVVEGSFLSEGQEGVLVPRSVVDVMKKDLDVDIAVGGTLKISGGFGGAVKIRDVPVIGIITWNSLEDTLNNALILDAQTARTLLGMTVGTAKEIPLNPEDTSMMDISTEDDSFADSFFSDDLLFANEEVSTDTVVTDMATLIGDTTLRDTLARPDSGAWHYILLKLKPGIDVPTTIAELNTWFDDNGYTAEAVNWEVAAGSVAALSSGVQVIFNVLIIIIAVVAIIIIMNTLVVSVIERTGEIGTMRALGAGRGFVRSMFTIETLVITTVFGLIGIVLGAIVIGILNMTGIPAANSFFAIIFGGNIIRPVLSASSLITGSVIMLAIGLVASIYPVSVALNIKPVRAIQTE